MKNFLKVLLVAVFLGGMMAFLFYKDIKKDVIAVVSETDKVYIFQVGVFKYLDNASNLALSYPSGGFYQDQDLYRVIIGVTKSNKEKLEEHYNAQNIEYYIKEVIVNESFIESIIQYDEIIKQTKKFEVIDNISKKSVDLYIKEINK